MKSIDYKKKLIRHLNSEYPLSSKFTVAVKKLDLRKDIDNLRETVIPSISKVFTVGQFYDTKANKWTKWAVISTHPNIREAITEVQFKHN